MKSSHSDKIFYVHEDKLKHSCPSLYSVCSRMWFESQERVYKFDKAVSEDVILCFLNFLYHGHYSSLKANTAAENPCSPNDQEVGLHPLLLHAQIYVFADTYFMVALGGTAYSNLKCHLRDMGELNTSTKRDSVLDLIEYAFDNLRDDDNLLVILADYVNFRLFQLRLSPRLVALLMGSDGKLLKTLLPKISGSSRDPLALGLLKTDPFANNNRFNGTSSFTPRSSSIFGSIATPNFGSPNSSTASRF